MFATSFYMYYNRGVTIDKFVENGAKDMKKKIITIIAVMISVTMIFSGCGKAGGENVSTENVPSTMVESTQTEGEGQATEDAEYENFAIANVTGYVNVRLEPNTESEIVGKIYDGAVAQILATAGDDNDWLQIVSGNVEGYIKAEFFIHGQDAADVMDQYVTKFATVNVEQLNVRDDQSTSGKKIGYLEANEVVRVLEDCGEWLKIQYTSSKTGYVSAEFVTVSEDYVTAKTMEEIETEMVVEVDRAQRVQPETPQSSGGGNNNNIATNIQPPSTTYTTNAELRQAIIDYAMQYLGSRYVHGGQSLASGTDCSGFTMYVLAEFGYSIGRTPQSQYTSAGRAIDYSQVQPGDIICYSSNGGASCTHVGFYIGNGQILHAANSRDGVKISSATYSTIYGVRNVID